MHLALIVFPLLVGATAVMAQQQVPGSAPNSGMNAPGTGSGPPATSPTNPDDRTGSYANSNRANTNVKGERDRDRSDNAEPKSGDRQTGTPDGGAGTPTAH